MTTTEQLPSGHLETDDRTHELGQPVLENKGIIPDLERTQKLRAELGEIRAFADHRAEQACQQSEFEQTPEVSEAIRGYYQDHYQAGFAIDKVLRGEINSVNTGQFLQGETKGDSNALNESMRYMIASAQEGDRKGAFTCAADIIKNRLFQESSVGGLTAGEMEVGALVNLTRTLKQQAIKEGIGYLGLNGRFAWEDRHMNMTVPVLDDEGPAYIVEKAKKLAYEDSRPAGKLLYHNTGYISDIVVGGNKLKTRTKQLEDDGVFNAQTMVELDQGRNMHANVPHFSEFYDRSIGYKINSDSPGTVALPIAEVIKVAPYARSARYGVVSPKPQSLQSFKEKVPQGSILGDVGVGVADTQGKGGGDRVFFAGGKADQAYEANCYEIDFGSPMQTDHGNESFIITTAHERRQYPKVTSIGRGEGMPSVVDLDYSIQGGNKSPESRAEIDANVARLEEQITGLEDYSQNRPEFKDKFVVPLRVGVIEYRAEDNDTSMFAGHREVDISKIPGSVRAAAEARQQAHQALRHEAGTRIGV